MIEYADLVEVRKKYFEERSLYSLFRNVNPEKNFVYLKETGMAYKVKGFLKQILCREISNCDIESLRFCRNMCDFVCVFEIIEL